MTQHEALAILGLTHEDLASEHGADRVRWVGTVPDALQALKTFRTQAQIQNGGLCQPPPPG